MADIIGTSGDDILVQNANEDDRIDGLDGIDTLDLSGMGEAARLFLALAAPQAIGVTQGLDSVANIENVIGTAFDDLIVGVNGGSHLQGGGGNDHLQGRGGADLLDGGIGDDLLLGRGGDDVLLGSSGKDVLRPGEGNDLVDGSSGTDRVDYSDVSRAVSVDLSAGTATDLDGSGAVSSSLTSIEDATGTAFDDQLTGDVGPNRLYGRDGNDTIDGGAGNDTLAGGAGDDVISTGGGRDYVVAGSGNDHITTGLGRATVVGEEGEDTIDYSAETRDMFINLTSRRGFVQDGSMDVNDRLYELEHVEAGSGNDTVVGTDADANRINLGDGDDYADGKAGDDIIAGQAGNDTLIGRTGNDDLQGGAGDDYLRGDEGDDVLIAGDGSDTVLGGDGADRLIANGNAGGINEFTGGVDGDVFEIHEGLQTVHITDFTSGLDIVDLQLASVNLTSFGELLAFRTAADTIQIGDLTLIMDGLDIAADLTGSDFGLNNAPVTTPLNDATNEDVNLFRLDLLTNQSDPEGDALGIANLIQIGGPDANHRLNGSNLELFPGRFGNLEQGQQVELIFQYDVSDGKSVSTNTATVIVHGRDELLPTLIVPTARDDAATLSEDGATTVNAVANDSANTILFTNNKQVVEFDASAFDGTVNLQTNKKIFEIDANGAFEYLAVGESVTQSIHYAMQNGVGGRDNAFIDITVTGANDGILGFTVAPSAALKELDENHNGASVDILAATGAISFSDADLSDQHSFTITPQGADYRGALTASVVSTAADGARAGQWLFEVSDGDLDDLSEGEVLTQTYDILVEDGHGSSATASVTITLTGTNDSVALISIDNVSGSFTEELDGSPTENVVVHSAGGTLLFDDVDINDTHTVTVVPADVNYRGAVSTVLTDSTGIGQGGVAWQYDVADSDLDDLGEGQTLTQTYDLIVSDGFSQITETLTITLTGTNDAPIVNAIAETVFEDGPGAQLTADFIDNDPGDTHTFSIDVTGTQGSVVNNGDGTFDYDPNSAFESLAAGETATDSFTYTVTDSTGGVGTNTATITVTGQNDAASISGDNAGTVTEDGTPGDGGVVTVSDVDNGEAKFVVPANLDGSYGTFTFDETGNWTYALDNTNANVQALGVADTITDSLSVTSFDGTASETITVTINGTNDGPVISSGPQSGAVTELADGDANENSASHTQSGSLVFGDVDLSDTHQVSITPSASGYRGALNTSLSDSTGTGTGAIGWQFSVADSDLDDLADGQTLTQVYTIKIDDGEGGTDTQTVTITLTGTNDAPLVNAVTGGANEDGPAITLAADFSDVDASDTHLFSIDTTGTLGSVTNNNDGTFGYNPNGQFEALAVGETATDSFTYIVDDQNGGVTTGTMTITITGQNDAPIVQAVTGGANEDGPAITLTADFSDIDASDAHLFSIDTTNTLGNVTNNNDGTFSYDPNGAFESLAVGETATDTFTYIVDDQNGGVVSNTMTVTITGQNDNPVANDDTISGSNGGTTGTVDTVSTPDGVYGLLGDSSPFFFEYAAQTFTAEANTLDSIEFMMLADSGSVDGFFRLLVTEVVESGGQINPTNVLFESTPQFKPANLDVPYSFSGLGLSLTPGAQYALVWDALSDADGQPSQFVIQSQTGDPYAGGISALNRSVNGPTRADDFADDWFETPNADIAVSLGFVANPTGVFDEDSVGSLAANDLLANDTDTDSSDTLTIIGPVGGTSTQGAAVTVDGNGDISYDPTGSATLQALPEGQTITDTFVYTISDGNGGTDTATVTLTVLGVNDPASISGNTSLAVTESDAPTSDSTQLTVSDVDAGEAELTPQTLNTIHGVFEVQASGQVTFQMNVGAAAVESLGQGETATHSVTVVSKDGTASETVIVTITGQNDAPVVNAVTGGANEDGPAITLTADYSDVDANDTHLFSIDTTGTAGSVTNNNDGTFGYNPNGQFEHLAVGEIATDSFTYIVDDQNGGVTSNTMTVTITGTNNAPGVNAVSGNANEDGPAIVLAADFSDADASDTHSFGADVTGTLGNVTNNGDGTFGYDPNGAFESLAVGETATDSFTYNVNDGNGGVTSSTMTVTITGQNDAPTTADVNLTVSEDDGVITEPVVINDVDANDTHTVTVHLGNSGALTSDGTANLFFNSSFFDALSAGQVVTEVYTFTVADNHAVSDTATATITVNGQNDAVQVTGGVFTGALTEGSGGPSLQTGGSVLIDDVDLEDFHTGLLKSSTSSSALGAPTLGSISFNADQNPTQSFGAVDWSYTVADGSLDYLAAGETETETFTFAIADSSPAAAGVQSETAQQSVVVTLTGENDAVVFTDAAQSASVTERADGAADENNVTHSVSQALIFSDVDLADTHSVTVSPAASGYRGNFNASVVEAPLSNAGAVNWSFDIDDAAIDDLAAGQTLTQTYNVQIADATTSDTRTVTITITGAEDAPVVQAVTGAANEDGPSILLTADFSDADTSDSHSFGADVTGTQGSVTNNGDGTFGYDPNGAFESLAAGQTASDSFTYNVNDGKGGVTTNTMTVTITGQNDAPNVVAIDAGSVGEDDAAVQIDLLDGQSDIDNGNVVSAANISVTDDLGAAVTFTDLGNGVIEIDPNQYDALNTGETRTITVSYDVTDGTAFTANTATLDVVGDTDNHAPVANDDVLDGTGPVFDSLSSVHTAVSAFGETDTAYYGQTFIADGTLLESIEFAMDDQGGWDDTEFRVLVTEVTASGNVRPTNILYESGALALPDGTDQSFSVQTGGVALTAGQTYAIIFDAFVEFDGQDGVASVDAISVDATAIPGQFIYYNLHGAGGTRADHFASNWLSLGDVDLGLRLTYDGGTEANEDASIAIQQADLLANDTDADGDALTIIAVSATSTAGALLTLNNDGTITFDPNGQFEALGDGETATDTFTYTIEDAFGVTDTATVTITVQGANDDPIATNQSESADEDGPAITITANARDADANDTLSFTLDVTGTQGSVTNNNDGTFSYDPNGQFEHLAANETTTDSFSYTVDDGNGGTDTATVTVTVTGENDAVAFDAVLPSGMLRASLSESGTQPHATAGYPNLSADGRYISFQSNASNLHPDDGDGTSDIFVLDRQTGALELISQSTDGVKSNNTSLAAAMSGDGRFVSYFSAGSNLVANDTNGTFDIFVYDRDLGTTELVSKSSSGVLANGPSYDPRSSADGRFITFQSHASNLHADDSDSLSDIFVYDRDSGTMDLVSVSDAGVKSNGASIRPSISADGRFVAFYSSASNLDNNNNDALWDVFVYDRDNDDVQIVSVSSTGVEANNHAVDPSISADGRFVAFHSFATNLHADDTDTVSDIFVYDRDTGITELVSRADDGTKGSGSSFRPSLSADGRFVSFESEASNLVAGDTNGRRDIFVYDRQNDTIRLVSQSDAGVLGNSNSYDPSISADGNVVSFGSDANSLVAGDTNGVRDAFVHTAAASNEGTVSELADGDPNENNHTHSSTGSLTFTDVDLTDTHTVNVIDGGSGYLGALSTTLNDSTGTGAGSVDWEFTIDDSAIDHLGAGDTITQTYDLQISDGSTTDTQTVTVTIEGINDAPDAVDASGATNEEGPAITVSSSFADVDTAGGHTITVDDTGTTGTVTDNGDGTFEYDPNGQFNHLSAAQTVADTFTYSVDDGEGGVDTATATITITGENDAVAFDALAPDWSNLQSVELVSVASDGTQSNQLSNMPVISADGRFVAFETYASNLVAGDTNNTSDIFVYDRQTDSVERVSVSDNGTQGNSLSLFPSISADGQEVLFRSESNNLIAGDANGLADMFVYDRGTDTIERVNESTGGAAANSISLMSHMSGDGRFVVFESWATNLVAGDTNNVGDVFLHDRDSGVTTRVSTDANGNQGNGYSFDPMISADGNVIAFYSDASNLVAGDTNSDRDIFVYDRTTQSIERIVADINAPLGSNQDVLSLSADGRFVAFESHAGSLVAGDTNGVDDIFVHDRQTGTTERVSVASNGDQANGISSYASISGDGRFVTFYSEASNLVANDTNGDADVFVHDRQTGETHLVSQSVGGVHGNGRSEVARFSSDGWFIAATSSADNLVAGDANGLRDVFVFQAASPNTTASVTELSDSDPNENNFTHTAGASLGFSDVDLADTHTVQVIENGSGYLGTLSTTVNDSTGTGTGSVDWEFSVADSAIDHLAAGETLTQSYDLKLSDGSTTDTQTVTVTITGTNDAPVVQNNQIDTNPNTPVNGSVRTSDPDATDTLTYALVDDAGHGSVSFNADGSYTYTPDADYSGADRFSFSVSDGTETIVRHANVQVGNGAAQLSYLPAADGISQEGARVGNLENAPLADGGHIVVWEANGGNLDDSDVNGIYGQRFDANGDEVGSTFLINSTTSNYQTDPAVAGLANGGFVVMWHGTGPSGNGLMAQMFDANGNADGGELNITTAFQPGFAEVVGLSGGGFAAQWRAYDAVSGSSEYDVMFGIYGADGSTVVAPHAQHDYSTGWQLSRGYQARQITELSNGNILATFSGADATTSGVFFTIYQPDGTKIGGDTRIDRPSGGNDYQSVAALPGGGFVVTWQGVATVGGVAGDHGIAAQIFDNDGNQVSDQFLVQNNSAGYVDLPHVAAFADDSFAIVWREGGGVSSMSDIHGQRFNSDGTANGGAFLISNDGPFTSDYYPSLSVRADDALIVNWNTNSASVQQRIITDFAELEPVALTSQIASQDEGTHRYAEVAAWDDGRSVVVWHSYGSGLQDTSSDGVYARLFDANGDVTGAPILVNEITANQQNHPTVTTLDGGGFVVVWQGYGSDSSHTGYGIWGRLFDDNGNAVDNEFAIHVTQNGNQYQATVEALDDGGFAVTWHGSGNVPGGVAGNDYDIYLRTFAADAAPTSGELRINHAISGAEYTHGYIAETITRLADGKLAVVWFDNADDDIYLRLLNADGSEFKPDGINSPADQLVNDNGGSGIQLYASVGATADGGFVVAWTDTTARDGHGYGIFAQKYDADGNKVDGNFQVNSHIYSTQLHPKIAGFDDGSYAIVWQSYYAVSTNYVIVGQRFNADGTKLGYEFLVSSQGSNYGDEPTATAVGQDLIVSWRDGSGDITHKVISDFEADTAPVTSGDLVSEGMYAGIRPDVATLNEGGYVVTWYASSIHYPDSSGNGVYARLHNDLGQPVGDLFLVNQTIANSQGDPSATALDGGGFVIVWEGNGSDGSYSGNGIWATIFDANGNPLSGEISIDTKHNGSQADPNVQALDDGGFIVNWMGLGNTPGGDYDIYQRSFDANGNATSAEVRVNHTVTGVQRTHSWATDSVARLEDGKLAIVWTDEVGYDIYLRLFNADGTKFLPDGVNSPVDQLVNDDGIGTQRYASVSATADGGFVVTWADSSGRDGDGNGIFAQQYDAGGNKIGVNFQVNTYSYSTQQYSKVAGYDDGSFVIAWHSYAVTGSGDDVVGQRFNADGSKLGTEFLISNDVHYADNQNVSIATNGSDLIVTWQYSQGGVFQKVISDYSGAGTSVGAKNLTGGDGNDSFIGSVLDDVLDGGAGDDILAGLDGNDVLTGGADADTFVLADLVGLNTITDFAVGEDVVDVSDFAAVTQFSDLALADDGTHTTITVGGTDVAIVQNVLAADLSADDFIFS